jgi:FtsP/CotA-like multicopper oxidase with cupredoxin domain
MRVLPFAPTARLPGASTSPLPFRNEFGNLPAKGTFDRAGLFVWHCHIVEHEDHEMMRPYRIGP